MSSDVKNIKLTISEIKQDFQRLDNVIDQINQDHAVLKSDLGQNLEKLNDVVNTTDTIKSLTTNKKTIVGFSVLIFFLLTGSVGGMNQFIELLKVAF